MIGHGAVLVALFGLPYAVLCRWCGVRPWCVLFVATVAAVPAYLLGNAVHEGCHAAGFILTGVSIEQIRLFPDFSSGQFSPAFVRPGRIDHAYQVAAGLPAPYLMDILILGAVWIAARRVTGWHECVRAAVLLVVCVRPLVSLLLNANGWLRGVGDFAVMADVFGRAGAGLTLVTLLVAEIAVCGGLVSRLRPGTADGPPEGHRGGQASSSPPDAARPVPLSGQAGGRVVASPTKR